MTDASEINTIAEDTLREIETAVGKARQRSNQAVSFIAVLLLDDGKVHTTHARIDSRTDHHFCDKLTAIMETWWDLNHKKVEPPHVEAHNA